MVSSLPCASSSFASLHRMDCHPSVWSGFYKKALKERQQQLRLAFPHLFPSASVAPLVSPFSSLSLTVSPLSSPLPDQSFSSSLNNSIDAADAHRLPFSATSPLSLSANSSSGSTSNNLDNGFPVRGLDERIADNMVENCIGTMGLPIGLALNFTINSLPMVIPMAVEEPSIIAAVSNAAKTISNASIDEIGFKATAAEYNMITAQVLLLDIPDDQMETTRQNILRNKDTLISLGNALIPTMQARGGGLRDITIRTVPRTANARSDTMTSLLSNSNGSTTIANGTSPTKTKSTVTYTTRSRPPPSSSWFVVHIHIDVCDAMGANCASTVAEGIAPVLCEFAGPSVRVGVRIVTNLNITRLSKASFRVPISSLGYKSYPGHIIASRVLEAYEWANDDPFRATTHNKGVMNGIDAVAVATGQDWRAVEAAVHSWAAGSGRTDYGLKDDQKNSKLSDTTGYRSLTHYWIEADPEERDGGWFCGELELPITVGTKGGVLNTNPVYQYTLGLMGNPNSQQLAMIMCAVGLAQNFAALRALTTEGIQKGHMHLHARNIAIAAGALTHAIPEVTSWMITKSRINLTAAKEYIYAHHLYNNLHKRIHDDTDTTSNSTPPSMFYFQEKLPAGDQNPIMLNIAFQSLGDKPVYLDFTEQSSANSIHAVLFGSKTHDWLMRIFPMMDAMSLASSSEEGRANAPLVRRLKILTLILNVLVRRLMIWCPEETRSFVEKIFSYSSNGRVSGNTVERCSSTARSESRGPFPKSQASSHRRRAPSRDTVNKKPSITRSIQSILNNVAKHAATTETEPVVDNPHSPEPPSLLASHQRGRARLFGNSTIDLTASGQFVFPDLNVSYANSMDWVLPDSGIFRSDIFDDELHLCDNGNQNSKSFESELDKKDSTGAEANTFASSSTLYSNALKPKMFKGSSVPTLTEVPTRRQILQVGLPLLLSIWQIFELWVTQYLGHVNLASIILEEQRLIVSSLVATTQDIAMNELSLALDYCFEHDLSTALPAVANTPGTADQQMRTLFQKFMSVHVKRAQCTLFMLLDLITFDPQHIKPVLLADVRSAGYYLEYEATIVHDMARLPRDYNAIFGDMSLEQLGIAVMSPHSPQLRFRRKSMFTSVDAIPMSANALSLNSRAGSNESNYEEESISLNVDGIRNSIMTYTVLSTKITYLVNGAEGELDQPSYEQVQEHITTFKHTLALEALRSRIQQQLDRHFNVESPVAVSAVWLEKVTQDLQQFRA